MSVILALLLVACCSPVDDDLRIHPGPAPRKYYGEPVWGPNGWIVFTHTPIDDSGKGITDSSGWYRVRPDGSGKSVLFTFSEVGINIAPREWSHDGQWISAHLGGQIFKVSANGDSIVQLTGGNERKFFPTWSPDDQLIAFTIDDELPFAMRGIYIVNSEGSEHRLLKNIYPDKPSAVEPSWSPTGSEIAFIIYESGVGHKDLYTIDTLTTQMKLLFQSNLGVSRPSFSPDGSKIVFMQGPPDDGDPTIWVINKDGTNPQQLAVQGVSPAWSSDGTQIVYVNHTFNSNTYNPETNGTLWIMNADGSNKQQLTN